MAVFVLELVFKGRSRCKIVVGISEPVWPNEDLKCFYASCFFNADVDECESEVNACHENALCSNTAGSYVCRCIRGFEGDGRICVGKDSVVRKEKITFQFIKHLGYT